MQKRRRGHDRRRASLWLGYLGVGGCTAMSVCATGGVGDVGMHVEGWVRAA